MVLCRTHRKERVSISGRHRENDLKGAHGRRAMAISQASSSESGERGERKEKSRRSMAVGRESFDIEEWL